MRTWLILLAWLGRDAGPEHDAERLRTQPVRQRLLGLIQERPGIHASELAREVDAAWGTVQYHLDLLRKAELVNSIESGRERRFYDLGLDPAKARLLAVLDQGRRGEIAELVRTSPGLRQVDICAALDVSRKTFRSSIAPLVETGLLHEHRGLHSNRYYPGPQLEGSVPGRDDGAVQ